ncbi:hypothetical protein [Psychrobacillus sp. BM2]|uniref:hypothetical protein n=1 Tax=Psychrobacillus sp. BM2 TaxID=3400421 RepID=UPI003B0220E8
MNQTKYIETGLKQVDRGEFVNERPNTSNKSKEQMTCREIEELMGCNRQTYRRVGGAIRNKR